MLNETYVKCSVIYYNQLNKLMGSYLMNGMIVSQGLVMFSLFYVLSIVLTMGCSDWFLIWFGLEINMMSFLSLVYCRSTVSVEICIKYFFIQSLGSGILMLMFYSEFKFFEFVCLSIISYKMGGGPFYFWFPSVCEGLSWMSCYFMMTVQKVLPLLLISFLVSMFLWIIIMISMFVGALGSFNQKNMKRMFSYSSIHHLGWMMMGNFLSEMMWVTYLFLYSMMIFGVIFNLSKDKVMDVSALGYLSSKWSFVIGMLSMGGMPPFLGFFMKWWLFYYLLMMDLSLLLLMVLLSVVMFYVYFRLVYMLVLGGLNIFSLSMMCLKIFNKNFEMFYMMGVNVGMVVWLIMM